MKYKKVIVGDLLENTYIIYKDGKALVIDPGDEAEKIIRALDGLELEGILITHNHFDHVGAYQDLVNYFGLKENHISFDYKVYDYPGHTKDLKAYYFPEIDTLFSGDFVFKGSVGRWDLGGNFGDMKESIRKLFSDFEDVRIAPGHGDETTLREEEKYLKKLLTM